MGVTSSLAPSMMSFAGAAEGLTGRGTVEEIELADREITDAQDLVGRDVSHVADVEIRRREIDAIAGGRGRGEFVRPEDAETGHAQTETGTATTGEDRDGTQTISR